MPRIFYAASGPSDLVESSRRWRAKEHNPTEISITFSSQIQDYCQEVGAQAYFTSTHPRVETVQDGEFTIEHRPKRAADGLAYHVEEIRYGRSLLQTARKFRADVALIDSGSTYYFLLRSFRHCGVKVIPILHNTLWPANFPPTRAIQRIALWLDKGFWKRSPHAVVAVSPECERQVDQLRGAKTYAIYQIRAQFLRAYFAQISSPPAHSTRPFTVLFIGRVHRIKGVFDLLEMARTLEDARPGLVHWEICGRGLDFDEFRDRHQRLALERTMTVHGWTTLSDLLEIYRRSHICIVPTRSDFREGLAMTAAEAILAGRPVVTNPVVPALEVLRPACLAARTNDARSHMQAVERLADDAELYAQLCAACTPLGEQFYDQRNGLTSALHRALGTSSSSPHG